MLLFRQNTSLQMTISLIRITINSLKRRDLPRYIPRRFSHTPQRGETKHPVQQYFLSLHRYVIMFA